MILAGGVNTNLHQDAVVTLSGHSCVRQPDEGAEAVAGKVALTATTLATS